MAAPLSAAALAARLKLPAGTQARLAAYVELLQKWNRRINLVGPQTLDDVWRRHILDSAQLHTLLPPDVRVLVDLGSGAGLPGLILGILGVPEVHLIESDARKCAFLLEAARVTATPVRVHNRRIEDMPPLQADIVTARALAPLDRLLDYAERFLRPGGSCYFLKGAQWPAELSEARTRWQFHVTTYPSLSDRAGAILHLETLARDRED